MLISKRSQAEMSVVFRKLRLAQYIIDPVLSTVPTCRTGFLLVLAELEP